MFFISIILINFAAKQIGKISAGLPSQGWVADKGGATRTNTYHWESNAIPEKIISTSEKAIPPIQTVIDVVGFIPSTPATPNPTSPIVIAQKGIDKLKDLITVSKAKIGGGAFQLNFLKEELQKVLTLLDMLDLIIELSSSLSI